MSFVTVPERLVERTSKRRRRWNRARTTHRGVSDVVATILLLALTVTLFSAIFAFVTSFPSPPAQNANQFSSSLWVSGGDIVGLNITHLAGPAVPGNAFIFLHSANHPNGPPAGCVVFSGSTTVSSGINTGVWSLGQVWSEQFKSFPGCSGYAGDPIPDNITVYIVSQSNLIYSVILPGASIALPPTILSTWTYPANPAAGSQFTVNASVSGIASGTKPYLNLAALYAAGTSQKMTYNAATGQWYFIVLSTNTSGLAPGTYLGFVNVTGAHGGTATASVTVTITTSVTPPAGLSVAVSTSVAPPQTGGSVSLIAFVTYGGTLQNAPLNVSFWVNQTSPSSSASFAGYGPAGLTISGPGTQTVVSTTKWLIPTAPGPRTYNLLASVTVTGAGSEQGNYVFSVPLGLSKGTFSALPLTTCTYGTNCPTFKASLYLNSTSYGSGPFTTFYSIYVNYTSNNTGAKGGSQNWSPLTGPTITPGTSVTLTAPNQFQPHKKSVSYTVTIVVYVTGIGVVLQNSYTFTPTS
jgi:hypothetical protein